MDDNKLHTKEELEESLTEKQKIFCHEYVIDWNGARAARKAGYSENTCTEMAYENLMKPHIKEYINYIKNDYELLCGITKAKQLKEYLKIAYSSISHLHNTWIELKEFESLTEDQKECIESIETKVEQRTFKENDENVIIDVKYVKIKLYSKLIALERIDKLMGYNEPDRSINENTQIVVWEEHKTYEAKSQTNNSD